MSCPSLTYMNRKPFNVIVVISPSLPGALCALRLSLWPALDTKVRETRQIKTSRCKALMNIIIVFRRHCEHDGRLWSLAAVPVMVLTTGY